MDSSFFKSDREAKRRLEQLKDGQALFEAGLGGDKAKLVYRLVSRLSRMYLIINRNSTLNVVSESAAVSLVPSAPYIDAMIATLRTYIPGF